MPLIFQTGENTSYNKLHPSPQCVLSVTVGCGVSIGRHFSGCVELRGTVLRGRGPARDMRPVVTVVTVWPVTIAIVTTMTVTSTWWGLGGCEGRKGGREGGRRESESKTHIAELFNVHVDVWWYDMYHVTIYALHMHRPLHYCHTSKQNISII